MVTPDPVTDPYRAVVSWLPDELRTRLLDLPDDVCREVEEIRLRSQRPVMVVTGRGDGFLGSFGRLTEAPHEAFILTSELMAKTLGSLSHWSLYALEDELRQGFLTLEGGHRVGMTGRAVLEGGRVRTLKDVGSLNLRISRALPGIGRPLLPHLVSSGRWLPTLIVSPPQCGKTTLLRDLVRLASSGVPTMSMPGCTVGVADERSEIAGCHRGMPQQNVGPRTDVLDGVPKAEGMMMLIRSMSPTVLVTDEIGRREDTEAVLSAARSGVTVLVSAHGESFEDLHARPDVAPLFEQRVFHRLVLLGRKWGPGTVEQVVDGATGAVLTSGRFRLEAPS